jgi:HlyD family secretion protein
LQRNVGWIALALGALAAAWYFFGRPDRGPQWRTVEIDRGDIVTAIAASGKLQALDTVEVGSQVSGQIVELAVDFNSPVRRGQVLARIDPGTFVARAVQSRAQAASAQANVAQAQARVAEAEAALLEARRDYQSKVELNRRGFFPERSLQALGAQVRQAEAALQAQKAAVGAQQAVVRQALASVQQNELDIERSVIRAPIDGVVIDRTINLGQTVAASFQAPKLFVIARDLSRMKVEAAVDEADIGRVRVGLPVRFRVDAFPDDEFRGEVAQVRIAGTETQNVVTYTVVIEAANPGGRLLPGMTANAEIVLGEMKDVVRIPAQALRWRPPSERPQPRPDAPQGGPGGPPGAAGGAGGGGFGGAAAAQAARDPSRAVERLQRELELSDEQARQVRDIMERNFRQMASGSRAERQRRREAMRQEISRVLTPEQQAKYAMMQPMGGGGRDGVSTGVVHVVGPDGKPEPRMVRTRAGDGEFAALVEGDIKPGDRLIVGEETPVES